MLPENNQDAEDLIVVSTRRQLVQVGPGTAPALGARATAVASTAFGDQQSQRPRPSLTAQLDRPTPRRTGTRFDVISTSRSHSTQPYGSGLCASFGPPLLGPPAHREGEDPDPEGFYAAVHVSRGGAILKRERRLGPRAEAALNKDDEGSGRNDRYAISDFYLSYGGGLDAHDPLTGGPVGGAGRVAAGGADGVRDIRTAGLAVLLSSWCFCTWR
ncbi:hypothetical protein OC844_007054 [Tilletia horrida]|nr:hypothetical protein OC844_007054 [Tilletia horrida]